MKIDKTELFNALTAIVTVTLAGGSILGMDFGSVPQWAIPIILLVALAVNWFSRTQAKSEITESRNIYQHALERAVHASGANPGEILEHSIRTFLEDDAKS